MPQKRLGRESGPDFHMKKSLTLLDFFAASTPIFSWMMSVWAKPPDLRETIDARGSACLRPPGQGFAYTLTSSINQPRCAGGGFLGN
jgi:hypothetical protein